MTTHIPAVLHACMDSRKMALKSCKPSFSEILSHPVYFDERKDTLAFRAAVVWDYFLGRFIIRNDDTQAAQLQLRSVMLMEAPKYFLVQEAIGGSMLEMFRYCRNLETFMIQLPEAIQGDVHGVLKRRQENTFNDFCDLWRKEISELELRADGGEEKEEIAAQLPLPKLIPLSRKEILEKFPSGHSAHNADLCKPPTVVEFPWPPPEPTGDDELDELNRWDHRIELEEWPDLWYAIL